MGKEEISGINTLVILFYIKLPARQFFYPQLIIHEKMTKWKFDLKIVKLYSYNPYMFVIMHDC
jgi:hypothetical protein